MTKDSTPQGAGLPSAGLPMWAGALIVILAAGIVVLLGMLAVSIMERR